MAYTKFFKGASNGLKVAVLGGAALTAGLAAVFTCWDDMVDSTVVVHEEEDEEQQDEADVEWESEEVIVNSDEVEWGGIPIPRWWKAGGVGWKWHIIGPALEHFEANPHRLPGGYGDEHERAVHRHMGRLLNRLPTLSSETIVIEYLSQVNHGDGSNWGISRDIHDYWN